MPKDEQAERARAIPSQRDKMTSDGDSGDTPRDSKRKEAVAGDEDCHREPRDDPLCAELSGEPAYPQSGSDEPIDNEGHVTQGLNMYDDEIWEGPVAAM